MDKLRQQVMITLLVAAVILAGGWFLLVSPKHDQAEGLREQVAAQQSQHQQLQTRLSVLRAKAEELPAKQAELAEVGRKIPSEPALPDLVRALSGAAQSAGVELISVTPAPPVPVTDAAAAPAAAAPAPATPAAPGAAAAPAPAVAPAAAALTAVPLTIDVAGDYSSLEQFLVELEDLPRALRVTGLTVKPGAGSGAAATPKDGSSLTSSITGQVYLAAGTTTGAAAQPPTSPQPPAGAQPPAAAG